MMDGYLSMMHGSAGPIGHTGISADPEKNNDYLLIKNLPGYKAGCIFTMGPNYIYYISHDPDRKGWQEIFDKAGEPHIDSLIRFNISHMRDNPEWFQELTPQVRRELKIAEILK